MPNVQQLIYKIVTVATCVAVKLAKAMCIFDCRGWVWYVMLVRL